MRNPKNITGRILVLILLVAFALTGSVIAAVAETAPEAAVVELKIGDRGDDVAIIQNALVVWDPDALPLYGVDGIYGSETAEAISAFQTVKELTANGVCDAITRELLLKNAEDAGVTVTAERSPAKQTAPAAKKRSESASQSSGKTAAPKRTTSPEPTAAPTSAPTHAPEATKQPTQPEVTPEPETTQPPAIDVTREPEATATATIKPTKAPEVTKKPSATETPEATEKPEVTPSATPEVTPSATPECEHNWVENTTTHEVEEKGHYETVHHDEVTEEQQVLVKEGWKESYTIYECPECGNQYKNMLGFSLHQSNEGHGGMSIVIGSIQHPAEYETQTVVVQEAYDDEVWVVDEPAHTEEIPNGTYTCSKCGATK